MIKVGEFEYEQIDSNTLRRTNENGRIMVLVFRSEEFAVDVEAKVTDILGKQYVINQASMQEKRLA